MFEPITNSSPLPSENIRPVGSDFHVAADDLRQALQQPSLTRQQQELGEEIVRRIIDIGDIIDEIRPMVKEMFADQETDPLFKSMWESLKSDPRFQPKPGHVWRVRQAVAGAESGTEKLFSEKGSKVLKALRRLTEQFYDSAHRVLDCFKAFTPLRGIDCLPIRIVRNQLIVHPNKEGHSQVTADTFSWSTVQGPHIKGVRVNGQVGFEDKGLYVNAEQLLGVFSEAARRLRL